MRRAFSKWELLAAIAVLAVIAAFLFPIFGRARENHSHRTPNSGCMSNLKQIGLAMLQYNQDYDERFPLAQTGAQVGWTESVYPYLKAWQLFHCSAAVGAKTDGSTDYFYNSRLVKFPAGKVENVAITILAGDGTANSPASYAIPNLPTGWATNLNSPANRHVFPEKKSGWFFQSKDYGANYLFADGHVKRATPEHLTVDSPKTANYYTFLPR